MLLANITVATHIHRAFPACAVLRRHEAPTPAMFKPLIQVRPRHSAHPPSCAPHPRRTPLVLRAPLCCPTVCALIRVHPTPGARGAPHTLSGSTGRRPAPRGGVPLLHLLTTHSCVAWVSGMERGCVGGAVGMCVFGGVAMAGSWRALFVSMLFVSWLCCASADVMMGHVCGALLAAVLVVQ